MRSEVAKRVRADPKQAGPSEARRGGRSDPRRRAGLESQAPAVSANLRRCELVEDGENRVLKSRSGANKEAAVCSRERDLGGVRTAWPIGGDKRKTHRCGLQQGERFETQLESTSALLGGGGHALQVDDLQELLYR